MKGNNHFWYLNIKKKNVAQFKFKKTSFSFTINNNIIKIKVGYNLNNFCKHYVIHLGFQYICTYLLP